MRAATAFNRLLGFEGTVVQGVRFEGSAVVVSVRLTSVVLVCPCGRSSRARYDRSRRRWRHVDFGRFGVWIEAQVRRVDCRGCGRVRTEWTSWARPGSRFTRDFEDMACWLLKQMSKSAVARLLRTSWEKVDALVRERVDEHLDTDRLEDLRRIGVDEIAYRGRNFLTVVADHDTGHVVYAAKGRSQEVFADFVARLPEGGADRIEAISMDFSPIYRGAAHRYLPGAALCFDPFHVIKWAGEALDLAYQTCRDQEVKISVDGLTPTETLRKVRGSLRRPAEKHDPTYTAIIEQLRRKHPRLHRAWLLKEDLRQLYKIPVADTPEHLRRWIRRARGSGINAFAALAKRLHRHTQGILNAIHLGLSNSLLEAHNSGIRLLQARAHGYADLTNLIEMIYFHQGGITVKPPTET